MFRHIVKLVFISIFILLTLSLSHAEEVVESKDVINSIFFKGSFLSVNDAAYGMFCNPAVFARIGETDVSGGRSGLYASGASYAADIYEGFVSVAQAKNQFGWGLGLYYKGLSKDAFKDEADTIEDIDKFRTFPLYDYSQLGITFSMGKKAFVYVDKKGLRHSFTAGFHIKYNQVIAQNDDLDSNMDFGVVSADLGIIGTPAFPDLAKVEDLRIGLTAENLISRIFGDTEENREDFRLRLSGSCFIGDKFQPSADIRLGDGITVGAAYWFQKEMSGRFIVGVPGTRPAMYGFGFNRKISDFIVDLAVKDQKDIGMTFNLSLKGLWGPLDYCPGEEEDMDGFEDEDGCPDYDNGGDGILDVNDECPNEKGTKNNKGCPFVDDDGDGIPNNKDKCVGTPEDQDGFEDVDGCPDLDNDGDSLPDSKDGCPNQAENFNSYKDNDGCPDKFMEEWTNIDFEAKTELPKPDSFNTLYAIALFIQENPDISVELIVYGTDINLAHKRAEYLQSFLVNAGASDDRISTLGRSADRNYIEFNKVD